MANELEIKEPVKEPVKLFIGSDYARMLGFNCGIHTYLDEDYPYVYQELLKANFEPLELLCKLEGYYIEWVRDWRYGDVTETWDEFKTNLKANIEANIKPVNGGHRKPSYTAK